MKKRVIFLTAGLCMLAVLAGCGKKEEKQDTDTAKDYKALDYVTLGDYKGMEVTVEKEEVTEEDVKAYIENLLSYYPAYEYEDTDKTVVEDGDYVNIDYEGLKDGEAFSGGTASGYVLEIGSNSFIDGFEEGLIGAKVGDKLALDLTFPDPYENNPDLAGQAVVFNVTVNKIVHAIEIEITYENLTDDYVANNLASITGYDTVQTLKDGVCSYLESYNEYYAQSDTSNAIIEKLTEICTVEVPTDLLDERVKKYKEQYEAMCQEQYSMTLAEYLETNYQMTEEDFNTDTVEYMKENLTTDLILLAIAEKKKIELDEEGYKDFLDNMLSQYEYESEEELYNEYGEDYIKDGYICNKVMSKLMEEIKINYVTPADDTTTDTETKTETE